MKPRFLYLTANQRCNLRCAHCAFWQKGHNEHPPDTLHERVLEEFAEIAADNAAVCICGGENLLDPEPFYAITRKCRALGLRCLVVLNGTVKHDVDKLLLEGPTQITLSLDSPYPETHDSIRGVAGAWQRTVNFAHLLVGRSAALGLSTPLYAMAVTCERNYRDLDRFFGLVQDELRLDKLKLNFLQPTFGASPPDTYFAENVIKDPDALVSILANVDTKYGIGWNPGWIEAVWDYHASIKRNGDALSGWAHQGRTSLHICNSYERNIMVDQDGVARLCYYPAFSSRRLTQKGDLSALWVGADRASMRQCNRYCGISHSVRRESARL